MGSFVSLFEVRVGLQERTLSKFVENCYCVPNSDASRTMDIFLWASITKRWGTKGWLNAAVVPVSICSLMIDHRQWQSPPPAAENRGQFNHKQMSSVYIKARTGWQERHSLPSKLIFQKLDWPYCGYISLFQKSVSPLRSSALNEFGTQITRQNLQRHGPVRNNTQL